MQGAATNGYRGTFKSIHSVQIQAINAKYEQTIRPRFLINFAINDREAPFPINHCVKNIRYNRNNDPSSFYQLLDRAKVKFPTRRFKLIMTFRSIFAYDASTYLHHGNLPLGSIDQRSKVSRKSLARSFVPTPSRSFTSARSGCTSAKHLGRRSF